MMAPVDYQSRAFLIKLLREANIVEDIVEDVVEACRLAEFSLLSIASNDIPIETLAEKLYLTRDEALALRGAAEARLRGEHSLKSQSGHFLLKPDFQKMISLHVVASHDDASRANHHRDTSMLSVESFLGRDGEKKRVDTSSLGSEYQWTDSTTDREASDETFRGSSMDPTDTLPLPRQLTIRTSMPQVHKGHKNNGDSGDSLTDRNLAHHDKSISHWDVPWDGSFCVDCRPFVPRLQLEDAGLSYGPPNSICPSYETLDSLSINELEQLADLPVGHAYFRRRSMRPPVRRGCHQTVDLTAQLMNKNRRTRLAVVLDLPSYRNVSHCIHKTTASFEASKRVLRERQEHKAHLHEIEKSKMLPIKRKTKPSKRLSARLMQSTGASRARDDEVKKRLPKQQQPYKFSSTNTIPSMFHAVVFPPYH